MATAGWEKPGRRCPFPGTRTDILISPLEKYRQPGEFWLIDGDMRRYCDSVLSPFGPRNAKASTGLCAAIMVRRRFPDEVIGVTGYDWTMHPEMAGDYRHDAWAEHECIKTLGVIEYG